MNKLTRISATVASSVALVAGFAGVAGAATIDRTGFSSDNRITHRNEMRTRVNNDNDVRLTNNNPQTARTGDASADRNTTGGDVYSGEAANDSMVDAVVQVDNGSSTDAALSHGGGSGGSDLGSASISETGAQSSNEVSTRNDVDVEVDNDTSVSVSNNNSQNARSGEASADRNTTVGNVRSGDAMNVSTATFEVHVTN